jgi:hypothetical protein
MAKQYGIIKIDQITYTTGTTGNEGDASIDVSGLARIAESGITVTGTISGVSGIFTSGLFGDGTAANPSITFIDDLNVGLYRPGDDQLGITAGGINAILISGAELTISGATNANSITATGAVISRTLQVSGAATVTGNLDVSGNTYVRGNLEASGNTTLSGTLTVSGAISGVTDGGVYGSGYWKVPAGIEGARPVTALSGMIRYNTTIDQYEGFGGGGAGAWSSLGGGATGSGGDRVFVLNETGVTTDYTLSGFNASSAGPITIADGIDVIIADDFNWSIV